MREISKPGDDDNWLRFIAQNSSEIVMVVDPDGTFRYASPTFGRIMGYDPGEAPGENLFDLVHPDDVGGDGPDLARLLAGEIDTYQTEKCYRHKDGHPVWVLLHVAALRNANPLSIERTINGNRTREAV